MSTGELPKPGFGGMTARSATPLRHFKGKLVSYVPQQEQYAVQIHFAFTDLEVFESDAPYLFPIADVPIKYHESAINSAWGHLGTSVATLQDCELREVDLDALLGKVQEWKRTDNFLFGTDTRKDPPEEMRGIVWDVVSVDGLDTPAKGGTPTQGRVKPVSAVEIALGLLDGKSEMDFWKDALTNPDIKKDADLSARILDKTFITAMIEGEKVTVDDNGIYHVV